MAANKRIGPQRKILCAHLDLRAPYRQLKQGKTAAYSAYHFDVQATAKAARANVNVLNSENKH